MAREIDTANGAGNVEAYKLAPGESFSLRTITFVVDTDNSGNGHSPEVLFGSQSGGLIARVPDWNDLADNSTVTYTFGVGLRPFCGITNDGGSVQNDLPECQLENGCTITVQVLDAGGAVVAGDRITDIVLWVEDTEPDGGDLGTLRPFMYVSGTPTAPAPV